MSGKLVGQVFDLDLPPHEILILVAIAENGDDFGKAFPSINYLAWKVGLSKRQVQRIMSALRAKGLLRIERWGVGGRGNIPRYRVVTAAGPHKEPWRGNEADDVDDGAEWADEKDDAHVTLSEQRVTPMSRKGDAHDAKGCHPRHPNRQEPSLTVVEPSNLFPEQTEPRRVKRQLPAGWQPSPEGMAAAAEKLGGRDRAEEELAKFRDWCAAKGEKYIDFEAAFRNWCRNAVKFAQRDASKPRHAAGGRRYEPMPF